jgi:hypothetical protein
MCFFPLLLLLFFLVLFAVVVVAFSAAPSFQQYLSQIANCFVHLLNFRKKLLEHLNGIDPVVFSTLCQHSVAVSLEFFRHLHIVVVLFSQPFLHNQQQSANNLSKIPSNQNKKKKNINQKKNKEEEEEEEVFVLLTQCIPSTCTAILLIVWWLFPQ